MNQTSLNRGFAWNGLGQLVTSATLLIVIPVLVDRLGLRGYGVYTLAVITSLLLQQLDGGLINAATRYLGIAVGEGDRKAVADYFVTVTLLVLIGSSLLGAAVWLLAPQLVGLVGLGPALTQAGVFAARVLAIGLPIGMCQSVFQAVLTAHGNFHTVTLANILTRAAYVAAVITLVGSQDGVREVMRLTLLQQCAWLLLIAPSALRSADAWRGRLLSIEVIRGMLRYSAQIQLAAVTAMVNTQIDAIIVAAVLPVRYVGLYGTGANVVAQLRAVPMNFAGPLVARLTQVRGGGGEQASFDEYARVQSAWVIGVTGFCAIATGAAIFQIEAWLGPDFIDAGVVCAILMLGNFVNILTLPLTVFLQANGRPDIDVSYGALAAALNLVLTLAFLWLGLYGIVGATAAGALVGSAALLKISRMSVRPDVPSFLRPIPWAAALAACGVSAVASGLLGEAWPGRGAVALVVVSLGFLPGGITFAVALLGPRRSRSVACQSLADRSVTPLLRALLAANDPVPASPVPAPPRDFDEGD